MKDSFKPYIVSILTWQAKVYLSLVKPKIVAITGSVGKTTTKDMVYATLQNKFKVRAAKKSYNSEIGIPLTVLDLPNGESSPVVWAIIVMRGFGQWVLAIISEKPQVIVCEVGTDIPGDITAAAAWLCPDVVIYTALAKDPVHLEFFESRDQLFNEKKQLAVLSKNDAVVIYNADDEFLPELLADLPQKKISFGKNGRIAISAESVAFDNALPSGMQFTVTDSGESTETDGQAGPETKQFLLPKVAGDGYVYGALASIAVAEHLGMKFENATAELAENFLPEPGRGKLIKGTNNTMILDESYNASPRAVRSLFKTLKTIQVPQVRSKILILGDMKELGAREKEIHSEIGTESVGVAETLLFVGILARDMYDAAIAAGADSAKTKHFATADEAGEYVKTIIAPGDLIAAKGSRHSIRLERALVKIVDPVEKGRLVQDYID